MGTSGTENRRTHRYIGRRNDIQFFTADGLTQQIGAVFSLHRQDLLADALDAHRLYLLFDHRIKLFYNIKFLHFGSKFRNQLFRKGVHHAKL